MIMRPLSLRVKDGDLARAKRLARALKKVSDDADKTWNEVRVWLTGDQSFAPVTSTALTR